MMMKIKDYFKTLVTADHPQSAYMTGLRAYAALFVFLIHANGAGLVQLHPRFANLVSQGQHGVIIFFVLSGYVITLSILNAKDKFTLGHYWQRRILRILPLYYFLLAVTWVFQFGNPFWQTTFPVAHDIKNLALYFVFYGLVDQRYMMNGLGIDWTIIVEFTFYLLLPIWVLCLQRKINPLIGIVTTVLFYELSRHAPDFLPYKTVDFPHENMMQLKEHWSPYHYIPYFFLPCFAAFLINKYKPDAAKWRLHYLLPLAFILFVYNAIRPLQYQEIVFGLMTGMVLIGCLSPSWGRKVFFENPAVILLGKISFSFYLLHYMFLNEIKIFHHLTADAVFVFIVTLVLSIVTYTLIERPFQNYKPRYKTVA